MPPIDDLIARVQSGAVSPLYLVAGDRTLAEPSAIRLGEALAAHVGCEVDVLKRPESLGPALQDLRTFAMFAPGKVTVVIDSSTLADAETAPALVDEAIEVLPVGDPEADLGGRERRAAACLLQAVRLLQLDPYAGSSVELVEQLPAVLLEGGAAFRKKRRRKRGAKQVEEARDGLAVLLEAARRAEIQGLGEGEEDALAGIVKNGLPEGHFLVLGESTWAPGHPVAAALRQGGDLVEVGQVTADKRSGWQGLGAVCRELERETGVDIEPQAHKELARRTLKMRQVARGREASVDADSTARFAAEYRKLATLSGGSRITLAQVRETVQDRGEEDIWGILDAIGEGRAEFAISSIERLLKGSDDVIGARLSILSLLAGFCRQMVAVEGMVRFAGVPRAERNYSRFKGRIASALQAELSDGRKNPLSGLHPYRLHRVYLAAAGLDAAASRKLQSRVLETEKRLKGGSVAPDAALTALVADVTTSIKPSAARR